MASDATDDVVNDEIATGDGVVNEEFDDRGLIALCTARGCKKTPST